MVAPGALFVTLICALPNFIIWRSWLFSMEGAGREGGSTRWTGFALNVFTFSLIKYDKFTPSRMIS